MGWSVGLRAPAAGQGVKGCYPPPLLSGAVPTGILDGSRSEAGLLAQPWAAIACTRAGLSGGRGLVLLVQPEGSRPVCLDSVGVFSAFPPLPQPPALLRVPAGS